MHCLWSLVGRWPQAKEKGKWFGQQETVPVNGRPLVVHWLMRLRRLRPLPLISLILSFAEAWNLWWQNCVSKMAKVEPQDVEQAKCNRVGIQLPVTETHTPFWTQVKIGNASGCSFYVTAIHGKSTCHGAQPAIGSAIGTSSFMLQTYFQLACLTLHESLKSIGVAGSNGRNSNPTQLVDRSGLCFSQGRANLKDSTQN